MIRWKGIVISSRIEKEQSCVHSMAIDMHKYDIGAHYKNMYICSIGWKFGGTSTAVNILLRNNAASTQETYNDV